MTAHHKEIADIIQEHTVFFSIITAFLIIQADLLTGEDIEFPILFAIPTGLAAWGLKHYLAYGLSVVLPLLRFGFVILVWERSHDLHVLVINVFITIVALIGYTYLIAKISLIIKNLQAKVKRLEENHRSS